MVGDSRDSYFGIVRRAQLHLLLRVSQMLSTRNCEGGSHFAVQPDTGKSPKRVEPENHANFVEAEVIWKRNLSP